MLDFTARSSRPDPTLVVDTSSLLTLTFQLPGSLYVSGRKPERSIGFLEDSMRALARRGHPVVFPAMVVFEAAEVFPDGASLNRIFPGSTEKPKRTELRTFFRQVRGTRNMEIACPDKDDREPASLYLRAMWKIASTGALSRDEARSRIIRLQQSVNTAHYGEDAAFDWMKTQRDTAFTFLSDDLDALCTAKKMGAGVLTSIDFVQVACESGLLASSGIKTDWPQMRNVIEGAANADKQICLISNPHYTNAENRQAFAEKLSEFQTAARSGNSVQACPGGRQMESAMLAAYARAAARAKLDEAHA